MRKRLFGLLAIAVTLVTVSSLLLTHPVTADDTSLIRTHTVRFKYVTKYKNRLVNAQAAFAELQKFLDKVEWKPKQQYSFNRDVLHNDLKAMAGYVDTPLGYGFGACGAPSLLNKMVKTATFTDKDGKEKPIFTTVMVWTWRGDRTYEQYGATIYLDATGQHTKDYVWRLNPEYSGPPPRFKIHFDMQAETVEMTMTYGNAIPSTSVDVPTVTGTTKASDKAQTNSTKPASTVTATLTGTTTGTVEATTTGTATQTITATSSTTSTSTGGKSAATTVNSGTNTSKQSPTPSVTPTLTPTATLTGTLKATKVPPTITLTPSETPTQEPTQVSDITLINNSASLPPDQRSDALKNFLKNLVKGNHFGVSIVPVGDASSLLPETGFNEQMQTYVASAFKGPLAIYFFENIDQDVWNTVPVRYWTAKSESEVPSRYRSKWNQYKDILSDLWTAAVWSQNDSTGNVLAYVYKNSGVAKKAANPIIAFNDWAHSIGVSSESGLRSWYSGGTLCQDCVDTRYGTASFSYRGKVLIPNNSYSPRDLAQAYVHLAEVGKQKGYYWTAIELLGTLRSANAPSMIQWLLRKRGIDTASKDGFVGPTDQDSDGYYISTDAGLLTLPDGKQFAVAFMALDSGNLLDDAIIATGKVLVPDANIPKDAAGR